jgi:NAD(P)H-hydrate repair Nnr-like enzyme with NAD(P)H-hydrate dehydratase domain
VDRLRVLEEALRLEEEGTPLVLDADAIILAKEKVFHGNVLLTPHPGELAAYSGVPRDEFLANPAPLLLALAREKRGVILFKSHVMVIASAEGRLAVVDGMKAALSAGGSGDLLAGLCAGIAARCRGIAAQDRGIAARGQAPDTRRPAVLGPDRVDLYACAVAGASLLIRAAGDPRMARRFADPLEFADIAADLAGRAWLPADRP